MNTCTSVMLKLESNLFVLMPKHTLHNNNERSIEKVSNWMTILNGSIKVNADESTYCSSI